MKQGYLRKTGILCLAIVFLMAAGCGKAKTQEAEENTFNTEAEVIAWEEEEQADNKDDAASEEPDKPAPREVVDGKIRSYFTGEWIDEELGKTRPLAIMLNNTSAALPMSGVSNASVIYECPVEGRITRWMGVFENWKNLERIGSVRSCRLYYLHFAQEFHPVYAHFGQAQYALADLNSGKYDVLSGGTKGIQHPATAMYDRISRPGKATEHTLYAFPKGIQRDIEKKGMI